MEDLRPDEKILFCSLFPENIPADKYLINCILFGVQIACEQDTLGTEGCFVQDLLAAEYDRGKSKSSMNRIEAFMASEGRGVALRNLKRSDLVTFQEYLQYLFKRAQK